MFGGGVLDGEGEGARGDGRWGWGEGAEVHEDRGFTVVGNHDVACWKLLVLVSGCFAWSRAAADGGRG